MVRIYSLGKRLRRHRTHKSCGACIGHLTRGVGGGGGRGFATFQGRMRGGGEEGAGQARLENRGGDVPTTCSSSRTPHSTAAAAAGGARVHTCPETGGRGARYAKNGCIK